MRSLLLALLLLGCTLSPAWCRDWFAPAHVGKPYVNAYLSPGRALAHTPQTPWHGQLVLWEGTVREHLRKEGGHRLVLETPHGQVVVHYRKPVLNLEHDRTGFRIAVKASLRLHEGRLSHLEGQSAILLSPPPAWEGPRMPSPPADLDSDRLFGFLAWWVGFHNPDYTETQLATIAEAILTQARANGLDPLFLASLIQVESAFDVDAVSVSGAVGLGQLMPFTAEGLGVDPHKPEENVAGAARMLAGLLREWQGTTNPRAAALASYNAGPNHVRGLGGQVPRFSQTTNYVYFIGYVHRRMTAIARARGAI